MSHKDLELGKQAEEKVYADGWTESSQDKLEQWLIQSADAGSLHDMARKKWTRFRDCLLLPLIGISGLTTFLLALGATYPDNEELPIVALATSTIGTVLTGVYNHYSPSERAQKHDATANDFGSLVKEVLIRVMPSV